MTLDIGGKANYYYYYYFYYYYYYYYYDENDDTNSLHIFYPRMPYPRKHVYKKKN